MAPQCMRACARKRHACATQPICVCARQCQCLSALQGLGPAMSFLRNAAFSLSCLLLAADACCRLTASARSLSSRVASPSASTSCRQAGRRSGRHACVPPHSTHSQLQASLHPLDAQQAPYRHAAQHAACACSLGRAAPHTFTPCTQLAIMPTAHAAGPLHHPSSCAGCRRSPEKRSRRAARSSHTC